MFEIVNDDRRTPDHGYTISSPMSLGSGQLKYILYLGTEGTVMAVICIVLFELPFFGEVSVAQ